MQQQIFRTAAMAAWVSMAATGVATAQAPAAAEPAAQAAPAKGDPAKAKDVLAAVAKAMGGDKLTALKSFTAEGEARRVFGEREMTGGIELAALLPDAFQVVQVMMRPDGMEGPRVSQTVKGTDAEVIAFVAKNAGAVGYVAAGTTLPPEVRALTLVD